MRIARGATRVTDIRIDQIARSAADIVKTGTGRPTEQFLTRISSDHLDDTPPPRPAPPRKPPGRPR